MPGDTLEIEVLELFLITIPSYSYIQSTKRSKRIVMRYIFNYVDLDVDEMDKKSTEYQNFASALLVADMGFD